MKLLPFIVLLFTACVNTIPPDVKEALKQSGANRQELEKVIDRYSSNKADSLKLKAAYFIIGNMPGHYSYTGDYLSRYRLRIDSMYKDASPVLKEVLYNIPLTESRIVERLGIVQDVEAIKSDFLIAHIDYWIDNYTHNPLYSNMDFKVFCDYALPYRYLNETLNDAFYSYCKEAQDSVRNYLSTFNNTSYTPYEIYRRNDFGKYAGRLGLSKSFIIPDPSIGRYEFECFSQALYQYWQLKSLGMPVFIDHCPAWANRNGQHSWCGFMEDNGNSTPINQLLSGHIKIYRMTYARNPVPDPSKTRKGEVIPEIFRNPFFRDVTGQYLTNTRHVSLGNTAGLRYRYGYLCVYNTGKWKPVAWGKFKGDKIAFDNLASGGLYLPACFTSDSIAAFGHPFSLTARGISRYIPDKWNTVTLRLERKYPNDLNKLSRYAELTGAILEASAKPDFSEADTLFRVAKTDYTFYPKISLKNNGQYRYYRFRKPGAHFRLAEIAFYDHSGHIIPSEMTPDIEAIRDNDPLSSANISDGIAFDFGQPVHVTSFAYMPMNDANNVFPGNLYELMYWDMDGWHSCGKQVADDYYIVYDHVPGNAVYLLKNLTAGVEERVFTYSNGKVRFW